MYIYICIQTYAYIYLYILIPSSCPFVGMCLSYLGLVNWSHCGRGSEVEPRRTERRWSMRPAAQLCPKLPLLNCRGAATEKKRFFFVALYRRHLGCKWSCRIGTCATSICRATSFLNQSQTTLKSQSSSRKTSGFVQSSKEGQPEVLKFSPTKFLEQTPSIIAESRLQFSLFSS